MSNRNGRMNISMLDAPGMILAEMARDVRSGLLSEPKDLSPWPKYFYDAEGSRIFEEITATPEYYQTGAELSILRGASRKTISRTGCRTLIELGSGSSSKTRAILDALVEVDGPARYVPFDVSESALKESGGLLATEYPGLEIQGYVGDFDKSLGSLLESEADSGDRLVIFLGGTIGNFSPDKRREFLQNLRKGLSAGDYLLIGMDLVKDRETLEAAYDDAAGITARFNKNLLDVLNHRLAANFDPELFVHRATYNDTHQRIEMWLDSLVDQTINIPALGLDVSFEEGEGLRTEISAKFHPGSAAQVFEEADLELLDLYTDDRDLFGLALAAPGGWTA
ncbi:MAG: L-histidine N(alpha)-methyltransferase [Rubrobacteraceae bacterium]